MDVVPLDSFPFGVIEVRLGGIDSVGDLLNDGTATRLGFPIQRRNGLLNELGPVPMKRRSPSRHAANCERISPIEASGNRMLSRTKRSIFSSATPPS